jgi:lipoprotein-anchoring transpeptidase ErfK/SrfK
MMRCKGERVTSVAAMCSFSLAACLYDAVWIAPAATAASLSQDNINSASVADGSDIVPAKQPDTFLIGVQVLLDRTDISPGVIDGFPGENLAKAVRTFEDRVGLEADGEIDEAMWDALKVDAAPVIQTYAITEDDVSGRYVKEIPEDFSKLAELPWIGYRGPKEMLAERFHMDEDLMATLNPGIDFAKPGTEIIVAAPGPDAEGTVVKVVVEGSRGQLLAYDDRDKILVAYPASVGSDANPSPSGTHKIKAIVKNPSYSYKPDENFRQGDNREPLELPPGPNNPVGTVWIDLSAPTYGFHGTSNPSLIDKKGSHGACA